MAARLRHRALHAGDGVLQVIHAGRIRQPQMARGAEGRAGHQRDAGGIQQVFGQGIVAMALIDLINEISDIFWNPTTATTSCRPDLRIR